MNFAPFHHQIIKFTLTKHPNVSKKVTITLNFLCKQKKPQWLKCYSFNVVFNSKILSNRRVMLNVKMTLIVFKTVFLSLFDDNKSDFMHCLR